MNEARARKAIAPIVVAMLFFISLFSCRRFLSATGALSDNVRDWTVTVLSPVRDQNVTGSKFELDSG